MPDKRGESDRGLEARSRADRRWISDRARLGQEQDRDPGPRTAEVRDGDVGEHGAPRIAVAAAGDQDHDRRQQRHQLPGHEKRQRVACAEHRCQREDEGSGEAADRPSTNGRLEIARGEHERRGGDQPERAEEHAAQPVDAETRVERAGERGTERISCRKCPEAGDRDEDGARRLQAGREREAPASAGEHSSERDGTQATDENGARHGVSSSRRIDCCSASWRPMMARPVSSRSKTRGSSTR